MNDEERAKQALQDAEVNKKGIFRKIWDLLVGFWHYLYGPRSR